jgi:hypothetical protein
MGIDVVEIRLDPEKEIAELISVSSKAASREPGAGPIES